MLRKRSQRSPLTVVDQNEIGPCRDEFEELRRGLLQLRCPIVSARTFNRCRRRALPQLALDRQQRGGQLARGEEQLLLLALDLFRQVERGTLQADAAVELREIMHPDMFRRWPRPILAPVNV